MLPINFGTGKPIAFRTKLLVATLESHLIGLDAFHDSFRVADRAAFRIFCNIGIILVSPTLLRRHERA